MLNEETLAVLKYSIATIPHDERGAFLQSDLVEKLAENLPALWPNEDEDDLKLWLLVAAKIVTEAMDDDGTPANGMLHLPGFEPYPYLPDQLLSNGKGYLIRHDDATPEFTQHAAELARHAAEAAEADARRIARIVNEHRFRSDFMRRCGRSVEGRKQ
jgi:hypothetical protein